MKYLESSIKSFKTIFELFCNLFFFFYFDNLHSCLWWLFKQVTKISASDVCPLKDKRGSQTRAELFTPQCKV